MDGEAIDDVFVAVELVVAAGVEFALKKLIVRIYQEFCMSLRCLTTNSKIKKLINLATKNNNNNK